MPVHEYERLLDFTVASTEILNLKIRKVDAKTSRQSLLFYALCMEQDAARIRFLAENAPEPGDDVREETKPTELEERRKRRRPYKKATAIRA